MPGRQQLKPRIGSIAEDEVSGLLRRLAFVNRPLTPDDIGADFICAVAKQKSIKTKKRITPMLYAGSWFLISVKSGNAKVGLQRNKDHFNWFLNLEIPFFIAQVENDKDLRVTIYHTLQHIAPIKKLSKEIKTVEFKCETSPKYKPNNFRIDHFDVLETNDNVATAWLGPPLLNFNRSDLLDNTFCNTASQLLQYVCDFHPYVHRQGKAGMDTGIMWETNKSIALPVKSYNIPALIKTTSDTVYEIEDVIKSDSAPLIKNIYQSSKPLFNFYRAMEKAKKEGNNTIKHEEVFNV